MQSKPKKAKTMIRYSLPSSFRAHLGAACTVALLGFVALPVNQVKASLADPAAVTTGDTFSLETIGFNSTAPSGDIYLTQTNLNPTFGTTQTFANAALGGQTLTVTSTESINAGITTDTIAVSVPTNFLPAGITDNNGNVINELAFSIGNINIPTGGTPNTLDFSTAVTNATVTGTVVFNLNGVTTATGLTQNPVFSNGNMSFSDREDVQSASTTTSISGNDVTGFSITLAYAAVPEPSTTGAVLLGAGSLLGLAVYRRRSARV